MQFVPNEDHRISLLSEKQTPVHVFVCPHPYWPIHPDDSMCQKFDTDDITEELVVNAEAQLVDPSLSYLFVTVIAEVDAQNKPLIVSDRAIGQIDNGVEHVETLVSGDRSYYVIRENANSDTFMINVETVNETGICVSYGYQELFSEECDLKITEPGTYSMDLSDAFEEHLHIMIQSGSDSL